MGLIGSLLTGNTSVATGTDSVLTGAGVCAPAPGLFITDGASFKTGTEGVLTAASAPSCANVPPGFPLFWFKADAGVQMNGSNQVDLWLDQTPNHMDMSCIDGFRTPLPRALNPIFTPNVTVTGLPGLDWGINQYHPSTSRLLQNMPVGGLDPLPLPIGAPRTVGAIVVPKGPDLHGAIGGNVITFRRTATPEDFMFWLYQEGNGLGQYGAGQAGTAWFLNGFIDYQDQVCVVVWTWDGQGNTVTMRVNGVVRTGTYPFNPFVPDNGGSGFSLGAENALSYTGRGWSGLQTEVIGYLGDDPALALEVEAYLLERAGI